jgi:predicted AlkP superfamily pyrophosphatase or phosphodiesterase
VASLPTVTLPNHTTLMTGAHPGHHGVLHNAWWDRSLGRQVVTESPATWQESMQWLFPGVETVHEAIHRRRPDAVTFSVNEPADRGADYATMALLRAGRVAELADGVPRPLPHADPAWVAASEAYRWGSLVDASAVHQARQLWAGEHLGRSFGVPTFCWVSFSLTDSAFHEGGPHSEIARAALRDTDARLGEVLDAVERRGVLDRTAVLLVADHGMEQVGSEPTEGWAPALAAAGIAHRDEASGFVYLDR